MNKFNNINNIASYLITFSICLQLYTMINSKKAIINPIAFLIFGCAALLSSYSYFIEDKKNINVRFILKTINGVMLIIIGLCAYN